MVRYPAWKHRQELIRKDAEELRIRALGPQKSGIFKTDVDRINHHSSKTLDLAAAGDVSVSEPGLEAEQAWEGNEEEWHGEDGEEEWHVEDGEDGEEGVWDEEEGAWDEEGGEWDEEGYTEAADSEKNKANYGIVASPPTSMIRVMV